MKKCLFTKIPLLIMLLLSVVGGLNAQKVYINEDFSSGSLPINWSEEKDVSSSASWSYTGGVATFDGGNKLGVSAALLTDAVDLSYSILPTLSFSYSNQHVRGVVDSLVISYRTGSNSVWKKLFVFDEIQSQQSDVVYDLTEAQLTEHFQLRFEAFNRFGGDVTIDNVKIVNALACSTPPTNLRVTALTSTSANLLWSPSANSDSARVVITTTPITNFNRINPRVLVRDTMVVSRQPVAAFISGDILTPAKKYYFYLRSSCGGGDVSEFISTTFTTPCAFIEVDDDTEYTEYFESGLGCWSLSSSTGDYATLVSDNKYEGSHSLYFHTDKSRYSYAVAPFDVDMKEMELSFYVYTTVTANDSVSARLRVSVANNPGDFSYVDDIIEVQPTTSGKWQKVIVNFQNYEGEGKYILLSSGSEEAVNTVYIDKLEVKKSTGCYEPLLVYADDVRSASAQLHWLEVGTATSWNIRVSKTPLTLAELNVAQSTDLEAATMPYTIKGLEPETRYYFYIQSDSCYWNEEPAIINTYKNLPLNYFDEFTYPNITDVKKGDWFYGSVKGSSSPSSWVLFPDHESGYISPICNTVGNNIGSDGGALNFAVYQDPGDIYPFVILPEIDGDLNLDNLQVSFYLHQDVLSLPLLVSMCEGYDVFSAVPLDTIYSSAPFNWEKFYVTFANYKGNGRNVMISPLIGANIPIYIDFYLDDLKLELLETCHPVNNISFDNIDFNDVTISWSDAGAPADATWTIELYTESKTDGAVPVKTYTASSSPFTMTGLDDATRYYASILLNSSLCENSIWSQEIVFKTKEEVVLPYFNDFSDEPIGREGKGGVAPTGWISYNETRPDSLAYSPYVKEISWDIYTVSTPYDFASPSLTFFSYPADKACFAVMPIAASAVDMSNLVISFYAMAPSTSFLANMEVGIMVDPNEPKTFTPIDTIKITDVNLVNKYRITTESYTGNGRYIAFRAYNDGIKNVSMYLDNLKVYQPTDCEAVTDIEVDAPTINSLDITWNKGLRETSWEVRVFDEPITTDNIDDITPVSSGTSSIEAITLNGFTHTNEYTYYVAIKSIGNDCFSDWAIATYTTYCDFEPIATPYFEKFDDYGLGLGSAPGCWYLKPYSAIYEAQLFRDSDKPDKEYGNRQGGVLYLRAPSATTGAGYSYAIMPMIDSLRYKTLEFYFYTWDNNAYVEVGVMEAVDKSFKDSYYVDLKATDKLFKPLFRHEAGTVGSYEQASFDFSSYNGEGSRIAFRVGMHNDNDQPAMALIDHLSVKNTEPCAKIRDVAAEAISFNSIDYSWSVLYESEWQVKVATTEIDPSKQVGDVVVDSTITSLPFNLKGLVDNTKYYCYARRIVKGENACQGEWSDAYVTRTLCSQISINYSDDFEANESTGAGQPLNCWLLLGDTDVLPYPAANSMATTGQESTDNNKVCLALENSSYTLKAIPFIKYAYAILPELDVDVVNTEISFRVYNPSILGGQIEVGVVTNPASLTTLNESLSSEFKDTIPAGEWTTVRVNFANYTGDDFGDFGKYIFISAGAGWTGEEITSNTLYIDDVVISTYDASACEAPIRLKAESVGDTKASFSWMGNNIAGYELVVNDQPVIDLDDNLGYSTVSTNSATISDLPLGSTLYAAVRAKCGDNSYSAWSEICSFRTTGCDPKNLPYIEDFENNISTIYNCQSWMQYDTIAPAGPLLYNNQFMQPGNCLTVPSGKLCILPFENVEKLVLKLDGYVRDSKYYAEVGVARYDANDSLVFVSFDDLRFSLLPQNFEVLYSNYADLIQPGDQMAILANAMYISPDGKKFIFGDIYIDNIFVDREDALTPPANISLFTVSDNAASFTATMHPETEEVDIAIMQGLQTPNSTSNIQTITDTTQLNITGLSPSSDYRVAMRAKADGKYTSWSVEELTFTTLQAPAQLPYVCGFEDDSQNADWRLITPSSPAYWTIASASAYAGNNSLYISTDGEKYGYDAGYYTNWAMRSVNISEAGSYEFSAIAKSPTNSPYNYLTLALVPAEFTEISSYGASLSNPVNGDYFDASLDASDYTLAKIDDRFNEWGSYSRVFEITEPGQYNVVVCSYISSYSKGTYPAAVDNIKVAKIDNSYPAAPVDLAVSNITNSSALVSWSVDSDVDACSVVITDVNAGTVVHTADNLSSSIALNELEAITRYQVLVKAFIGSTESVESIIYFNTSPIAVQVFPYETLFADDVENKNWLVDDVEDVNWWVIDSVASSDADTQGLYISERGAGSYNYNQGVTDSWVYRDFEISTPGVYAVSMMAKCATNDVNDFLSVSFIPASYEINFAEGEYTDTITNELVDLSNTSTSENNYLIIDRLAGAAEWKEYSRNIYVAEAGNYRFAALFEADNYWSWMGTPGDPAAIDSIRIEPILCSGALNFSADVSASTASLSWLSAANVSTWDIIVSDLNVEDATSLVAANIIASESALSSSAYSISDLSEFTTYYVYVKSNCDDLGYDKFQFTTEQTPLALPYYQSFNVDAAPEFWSLANNAISTSVIDPAIANADTTLNIQTGSTVVLPIFVPALNALEISFDAVAATPDASVTVGVVTDYNDLSTFTSLANFSVVQYESAANAISERIYCSLAEYTGEDLYIAIKANGDLYIDDVVVDNISAQCAKPSDITTDVESNKVTVSWTNSTSTTVVLATVDAYGISSLATDDIVFNTTYPANVSTCDITVEPATVYYLYLVSDCDDDNTSIVEKLSFKSLLAPKDIPYYESFENISTIEAMKDLGYNAVVGDLIPEEVFGENRVTLVANSTLQFPEFDPAYKVSDLVLDMKLMSNAEQFDISVGVLETSGDPSTFVAIETLTIPQNTTGAMSDFSVALSQYTGDSQNIAIEFNDVHWWSTNTLVFGSVNLYEISPCTAPTDLNVYDVTDIEASLSFDPIKNQTAWDVVVLDKEASQDELNELTADDAIFMLEGITSTSDIKLSNLTGLSTYYVYVRGNCDDVALWSDFATFSTSKSPKYIPYSEQFTDVVVGLLPEEWLRSNSNINDESIEYLDSVSDNYSDFAVANVDEIASSPLLFASMNSDGSEGLHYWAVSPEISIDGAAMLSFDLRLDEGDDYSLLADTILPTRESEIRLLISNDNAASWNKLLTIGDNASDEYNLYDCVGTTTKVAFDMSSYVGDTIRFAFYIDNEDLVYLDVNIDNVSINCMGERTYNEVISEGYDYNKNGFNILYTDLTVGSDNQYEIYIPSPEIGVCDSTISLNLTVLETVVSNITASICAEGDVYDENGFIESTPGLFLKEGIAANGADSLTYLTLVAREPNPITSTEAFVCEGEEFEFGGMLYDEAGIYYDTVADVNGCDSIIELTLSIVTSGSSQSTEATICEGSVYDFYGEELTKAGVYTHNEVTDGGCEYTVELTLSVVAVTTTYVDETINLDQLPYTHRGMTFDENTPVGEYTHKFTVDNDTDCPDIEIYTLKVIEGEVAVDDTRILDLSMYPNPLSSGATLYVDAEFTAAERNGMVIEVMNTVGQLIVRENPATDEITINGLTESGVYIVRITTGTGIQYLGKVIVK